MQPVPDENGLLVELQASLDGCGDLPDRDHWITEAQHSAKFARRSTCSSTTCLNALGPWCNSPL